MGKCDGEVRMMWGVDEDLLLYCYELWFDSVGFIVLVLWLERFGKVNW